MAQDFQNQIEENTSGQGENAYVPDIVAKRYNWGIFFFNWIWALVYQKYVLALIIFIGFAIPLVNLGVLIAVIWMGTQGNKWAWQAKKYQSIEEFHKIHKTWATVGTCLLFIPVIGIIAALTIPSLMMNTSSNQDSFAAIKAYNILRQGAMLNVAKEIEITDISSEGLRDYFNKALNGKCKSSKNRTLCDDGIGYIFESDGKCTAEGDCYIIVDTNGSKEPNEEWTDPNHPKDRIKIPLKVTVENLYDEKYIQIEVLKPDVLKDQY